jgi:hypothetical protein
MSKPNNPYGEEYGLAHAFEVGYAAGLAAGEKRLAMALRRWGNKGAMPQWMDVKGWLTARAKRRRGR